VTLVLDPRTNLAPSRWASLKTVLKLGVRELRGGLKGFRIFIACLALGVMVIAAVGALADALRAGLASQGETILGGDVTFARMHIRATPDERSNFQNLGRVSETSTLRTMARRLDGSDQALAELKAVDAAYPLSGETTIEGGKSFREAIVDNGAVVDPMLLERLGLKVGDSFRVGQAEIDVTGVLQAEPDAVADRLTYGPRIFVSLATLDKTALVKPGTLIRWRYAVKLPPDAPSDKETLANLRKSVEQKMPAAGFTSLDRYDPSPQITRTLDRLRQFLILIGLASLLVGGVGIASAVATFIDKRVKVVATLRSLGASGRALVRVAERIDRTHALGDCAAADSGPRMKAVLDNVRSSRGRVRLSLFGRDPAQWVRARGGKLLRFDVPATHGRMEVCMPLPDGPGVYALALYHDENADGKYSLASEGYGFSNNARAGLFGPPAHREAAFVASGAMTEVPIRLRY